jgi:hypothetical protein
LSGVLPTGSPWPVLGESDWPVLGENGWPILRESLWPIFTRKMTAGVDSILQAVGGIIGSGHAAGLRAYRLRAHPAETAHEQGPASASLSLHEI